MTSELYEKTEIYPETSYKRISPTIYGADFKDDSISQWFYSKLSDSTQTVPSINVIKYENVCLIDSMYIFDNRSEQFISWSCWDISQKCIDSYLNNLKTVNPLNIQEYLDSSVECYCPTSPIVHLAKAGVNNYGHFIVEILPKLLAYKNFGFSTINIVLPSISQSLLDLAQRIANTLKLDARFCFLPKDAVYFCRELYACTPVALHSSQKSPLLISVRDLLLESFSCEFKTKMPVADRIYIERASTEKRKFKNAEVIKKIHQRYNFNSVFPANNSLIDNISMIKHASVTSGGLGAGMTNIIFMNKGSKIILMFPGYHDLFFWDLACLFEIKVYWIFSQTITHWSPSIDNDDYAVNKLLLEAALKKAI